MMRADAPVPVPHIADADSIDAVVSKIARYAYLTSVRARITRFWLGDTPLIFCTATFCVP